MDERAFQHSMKAFESHFVASSSRMIKPWKVKTFRLVRYMDISQSIESDFIHSMFLIIQSLQLIYYNFSVYVKYMLIIFFVVFGIPAVVLIGGFVVWFRRRKA